VEDAKVVSEGLRKAIQAEREGHSFYLMAANATQDARGKEVFTQLAQEELDHMEFLTRQYNSILKTGQVDTAAKLGPRAELPASSPIFTDGLKTRIKNAHFEMSALSIGVQLELDAMKFYKSQAETASDPEVKRFFGALAEWESGHYHALLSQQEELRQDYWSANGFTAF